MFLSDLSDEQKRAFISLARNFCQSDGVLAGAEDRFLEMFCAEMGLEPGTPGFEGETQELLRYFDTRKAKVSVLLELIGLGYADGNLDHAENEMVTRVASEFGISQGELSVLYDWVARQMELVQEAYELMDE